MPQVVIVGGGVIGLACAYECLGRGWGVTLIERGSDERDGCSFGNAGMVVPSHFTPLAAPGMVALGLKWMLRPDSPFYVRPRLSGELLGWGWRFWRACSRRRVAEAAPRLLELHLASRAAYAELADAWGDEFGLVRRGLLMLCRTERALAEEVHAAEQARGLGLPAEVLDAGQVAASEPELPPAVCGGVLYPQDCHLAPERFVRGLQRRVAERGGTCLWGAEATGFRRNGRRIAAVETTRGEVAGDEFVLAGGAWSPRLARALGLRLPMQAGKGYSLTLAAPPALPRTCAILVEARVAVTPLGAALRFGGTLEISGLSETINPIRVRGIVRSAVQYYPALREEDFAAAPPWRGLRPCSPDGLPFLGRSRRWENLIVATGHAMMGLSLAPITGRIVGRLAAGEPPGLDLSLYEPERYG